MNNWILALEDQPLKHISCVEDLPNHQALCGFIYRITNLLDGKIYIGKKALVHKTKKKASKKEKTKALEANPRSRIKVVRGTKDSGWMNYYGSSLELKEDIKKLGKDSFKREIIELCCTKKYLSYAETKWQVQLDVLARPSYNGNIAGKWYRRDRLDCDKED